MPTKVRLVKAIVFPAVMYECESWTIQKAECWKIDAFELWCWRRLLRVPWTARRFNQSILKEISPEYSLEGLMLKLKLQYFGELTHRERPWCWERLQAGKKGMTEDEMVGWHHWLNGHEVEPTPGHSEGQGSLSCCCSWSCKSQTWLRDWTANSSLCCLPSACAWPWKWVPSYILYHGLLPVFPSSSPWFGS